MGGPIGVMSPKFLLHAGLLLVSARVDTHAVSATIDPSTPVSVFDASLAQRVDHLAHLPGSTSLRHDHFIGIDHSEVSVRNVAVGNAPAGAPLVIGADLLSQMIIGFDFPRSRLRVLDRTEYASAGRGMAAVSLEMSSGNCLSMSGVDERGNGVKLALVSSGTAPTVASEHHSVRVGNISFNALPSVPTVCPGSDLSIGWEGFERHRVLLDLAHHRMWVSDIIQKQ